MKLPRPIAFVLLAVVVTFALAGCGKTPPPEPAARPTPEGRKGAGEIFKATMIAFSKDQDAAKAEEGLRRSAALDASYAPARENLALFAEARRDWGEAIRWQGEIVTHGDIESSLAAKAEVARLQKIFTEWQTSAGRRSVEYNLTVARARELIDANETAAAIKEGEAACKLDAERPEAYAVLAEAAARQGRYPDALRLLVEATKHTPEEKRPALARAQEALQAEQKYSDAMREGEQLLGKQSFAEAGAKFSLAAGVRPMSDASLRAGQALMLAGKFDEAEQVLGPLLTASDPRLRREASRQLTDVQSTRQHRAAAEEMQRQLQELQKAAEKTKAELKEIQRESDETKRELDGQIGLYYDGASEPLLRTVRQALAEGAEIHAVAASGNAYAVVTDQGVLRANLPAALEQKLAGRSEVRRVALAKDGNWAVLSGKNDVAHSDGFEPEFKKKLAELQENGVGIADLDAASAAKWFILAEDGQRFVRGAPEKMTQAAQRAADRSADIVGVALAPDNSWVLTERDQGISFNVTSDRLKTLLREKQLANQAPDALGFSSTGGWVMVIR